MDMLRVKAFSGLAFLTVIIGVFLFLPAWTLDYWQAWVYLFVFSGSCAIVTLYFLKHDTELIKRRVKAGPTAEKEKTQKVIQSLANVAFILGILLPGLDHRFQWSQVPVSLVLTSDVIVLLGFIAVFLVFKENTYTSAIVEVDPDQKVISTGPYRFVRHPMYAGALVMFLFTPVALGSFWGVLGAFPLIVLIIFRLLDEERFLAEHLSGYKEYCNTTRYRLIPRIW
jgi:protein-S-isoprenylcysteine O-methyltransferase Ste14